MRKRTVRIFVRLPGCAGEGSAYQPMRLSTARLPPSALTVCYAGLSDVGLTRENNEDAWLAAVLGRLPLEPVTAGEGALGLADGALLAVSDGLGGAAAGEVASRLAVMELHTRLGLARQGQVDPRLARDIVAAANQIILGVSRANPDWRGMGATLSFIWAEGAQALIGQLGDSRMYRRRAGELEELTPDHSPVGRLRQSGRLTEQEARAHPHRHLIDQCLGGDAFTVMPDFVQTDLQEGDAYLLCTDGLTDGVSDFEIRRTLDALAEPGADPGILAESLVAAANRAGGRDNVTVLLARVEPAATASPD